ncbi:MAG: asparagine synthase (glutamine-hydrolyzing) [Rhizobacter sp.]|nr:asparagine synthase (glutamine-hydrolyzing) [Chlorobiales bacterium]
MCGIAGLWNLDKTPVPASDIDLLTDALAHRGPDGRGIWNDTSTGIALGHRRLSILDLSDAGHQPMRFPADAADAAERYWMVFNGEIYNFIELKSDLEKEGYRFRSDSDTEVVLAAYHAWGEAMLHRFNGMWAMAIYDKETQALFLSRDRFGVKPLYYYHDEYRFIFASEVQAIHKLLGASHRLNADVIGDVVCGSFFNHATDETYLQGVKSLTGGYNLHIRPSHFEAKAWYQFKPVPVPDTLTLQAAALRTLVEDACALRLRSDVPIGTCLSGGVDSGSIAAVINRKSSGGLDASGERFSNYTHRAFCAAFPNTPIDERAAAEKLVAQLRGRLDVIDILPPTPEELEIAMRSCDGPMHALAFFPIWKLYRHIKQSGITVTLDGQGPDEMLGGYRPAAEALQAAIDTRNLFWLWDVYQTYSAQGETSQVSSKAMTATAFVQTLKQTVKRWLGRPFAYTRSANLQAMRDVPEGFNALDASLYQQFFQSPLPGILNQYDRCSMAHGVECRMPFMDYRIVEFIFSLPSQSKVGGGYTKRVLREAMKDVLPDFIRLNKTKLGFNAPIVDWFRGPLKAWMLEQMSANEFLNAEHFDGKAMKAAFERFLTVPNPQWNDAWKFWPPVHLVWWQRELRRTANGKVETEVA